MFAPIKKILLVLVISILCKASAGQTKLITGTVLDSLAHLPLANVSITVPNSHRGVLTDTKGVFSLSANTTVQKLSVSGLGYEPQTVTVGEGPLTIYLVKSFTVLQDVVVKGRRGKYRNKNNPAVELIRQVIANKARNGPGADAFTTYRQYEKTRLLLDHIPHLLANNFIIKKYHFMLENMDSSIMPGRPLVPIYIEEVFSKKYYRKHPSADKKIVEGHKSVDYGEYLDMKGISGVINRLYEDINIYDNTVDAFTMQFVSPVADLAPTFYMYFIRDTIVEDGVKLVQLYFTPRNPEDLLFRGTLYITLDGHYAIRRAELGVSKHANLN